MNSSHSRPSRPGADSRPDNRNAGGKLIFVNRFFYPDTSATAQILSTVAFHLAQRGADVHVIASRAGADMAARETIRGVTIHRIRAPSLGIGGLVGRAVRSMAFHMGAAAHLIGLAGATDIVIAKTDPPLLCVPVNWSARLRRAICVNWLQDLYPETAFALGIGSARSVLGRILCAMRNAAMLRAHVCVAIGARMAQTLRALGVADSSIRVIGNFCDDEAVRPISYGSGSVRAAWGIDKNAFVVGYSGNLGRAHDLETMLSAADALRARSDIVFLFTGGGHLRDTLNRRADALGLENIMCQPYQPLDKLSDTLGVADVHWLSLLPELEGYIVPSKLYAAACAGRAVLAIGDPEGEAAHIIRTGGFGYGVAIGDTDTLTEHILALAADRTRCAELGAAARRFIDDSASKNHALRKWDELIASLRAEATRAAPIPY